MNQGARTRRKYNNYEEHCEHIAELASEMLRCEYEKMEADKTLAPLGVSPLHDSSEAMVYEAVRHLSIAAILAISARELLSLQGKKKTEIRLDNSYMCWHVHACALQQKLEELIWEKYERGQRKNKDNLWERSRERLLDDLVEEIVDGIVYGLTVVQ